MKALFVLLGRAHPPPLLQEQIHILEHLSKRAVHRVVAMGNQRNTGSSEGQIK